MAMRITWHHVLLGIIVLVLFATHLAVFLQQPELSYDRYFGLRQVDHIDQDAAPLYDDPLSYGGRSIMFVPFAYYLAGILGLAMNGVLAIKILSSLALASLAVLVYGIVRRLQQPRGIALLASLLAGFVPALFNPLSLAFVVFIPLLFLCLYWFMDSTQHQSILLFLLASLVAAITSPLFLILVAALLLHLLLLRLESYKLREIEIESSLFLLFFAVWLYVILFKHPLLANGLAIIRQNVPSLLLDQTFQQITLVQSLILIGIVPLVFGLIGLYRAFFQAKQRPSFIIISTVAVVFIALWLRWLMPAIGLTILGILLVILAAPVFSAMVTYINRSKLTRLAPLFIAGGIVVLLGFSILPSLATINAYQADVLPAQVSESLSWIRNNTPENTTVLATLQEGNAVAAIAQRKNVMDSQFLGITDIDQRYDDLGRMFTARFQTDALALLTRYQVQYILFTELAQETYNITRIAYLDPSCFREVHVTANRTVVVYEVACRFNETG